MDRADLYVKCPFYEKTLKREICCSGLKHIRGIHIQFDNQIYKCSYKIEHCDNDYKSCLWYRFLAAHYEKNNS